jgi:hypothetical protein
VKVGDKVKLLSVAEIEGVARLRRHKLAMPGVDLTIYIPEVAVGDVGEVLDYKATYGSKFLYAVRFAKVVILCSDTMVEVL